MNDLGAKNPRGCYNESRRIFGSFDPKYYDEIITKLNLTAREEYERSSMRHLLQNQRTQQDLHNQKKKKRILVVDDEIDICMVYQIVLQDAGYECVSYTDSVKALQEFRSNYYDLILLDIKMPLLNGFELCKKVREVDKTTHIIFITASEAYYEKFRSQHFPELSKINYIQKPIGNEELVQIVNTIVANSITVD
ncbi:MAG TPA: response regulator [Nitrososphaeraceae archaeon]|nr:response regulator [Nitrososphaeraceae archaeon]